MTDDHITSVEDDLLPAEIVESAREVKERYIGAEARCDECKALIRIVDARNIAALRYSQFMLSVSMTAQVPCPSCGAVMYFSEPHRPDPDGAG